MEDRKKNIHEPEDEILEAVWVLRELGYGTDAGSILNRDSVGILQREDIDNAVGKGLLQREGERYDLTAEGSRRARTIIRRHRLAERLFTDVLNIEEEDHIESDACRFEHFLSPEVTDHICILLGHPKRCPHGHPIPPGRCCEDAQKHFESAVVPLSELKPGESGRVLYMSMQQHDRLDRLTSLGLFPGRSVKVHQKEPLFVVFIGETQLALEKGIVEDIHVVRT